MTSRQAKLTQERNEKYLGSVDVKLSQLTQFDDNQPALQPNYRRVNAWTRNFQRSTVKNELYENHLNAVVSNQGLDRALQAKGLGRTALKENFDPVCYLLLEFQRGELLCLNGRSRVQAAQNIPPWDRPWPVDLYQEDISPGLRKLLRGNQVVQAPLKDGEILLTIEQYRQAGDVDSEREWRAYLSETKENNLIRIAGTPVGILLSALHRVPGLWGDGIHAGILHKMRSLHMNSEIVHYLTEIKDFFMGLVGQDQGRMTEITAAVVEALKGTALGTVGNSNLKSRLESGEILGSFSLEERKNIYDYMRSRKHLVPTISTFFQDIHILQRCAPVILKLIDKTELVPNPGCREPDIRASMRYMFEREVDTRRSENIVIEVSETNTRTVAASSDLRFELAYRQLWLYTIRNFVRPDHRKNRKIRFHIDVESEIIMLAIFASKLGFSSNAMRGLISQEYHSRTRIVTYESSARRYAEQDDMYGIPHPESWQWDRKFLFLDHIYSIREEANITSFFALQSMFHNFFGDLHDFTPIGDIHETNDCNDGHRDDRWDDHNDHREADTEIFENGMADQFGSPNPSPAAEQEIPSCNPKTTKQRSPLFTTPVSSSPHHSPSWNHAPQNPNPINSVDDARNPASQINMDFSINGISSMLDDLVKLESDICQTGRDMNELRNEATTLLGFLESFGKDPVNILQPKEQEQLETIRSQMDALQQLMDLRISRLADSLEICKSLKSELMRMNEDLSKPISITSSINVQLLNAINHLYKQLLNTRPDCIKYYRLQLNDDVSFAQQVRGHGFQCTVTFNTIQVSCLYRNHCHIFQDFNRLGEVLRKILLLKSVQNNEGWLADLKEKKMQWDEGSMKIRKWSDSEVSFRNEQQHVATLDVQSCQNICNQQVVCINDFHTCGTLFTDFIKTAQSTIQDVENTILTNLRSHLQAQTERMTVFQAAWNRMIDGENKTQIGQNLSKEYEALQHDTARLNQFSLDAVIDVADKYWNRIYLRNIRLDELEFKLQEETQNDIMSEGESNQPPLDEWKRRLYRIWVHVECVVGFFAEENHLGQRFEDLQHEFEKLANVADAKTQTRDTIQKAFDAALNQANTVESRVYHELTKLLQAKLMNLFETTAPTTIRMQLRANYEPILKRLKERQSDVNNQIELDASPDTAEHVAIKQLSHDYGEVLKELTKELNLWKNPGDSRAGEEEEAPQEDPGIREAISDTSRSQTRKSARQMELIHVKFWVRLAPGKWRPIKFTLNKLKLKALGAEFTQAYFSLYRVRPDGNIDPINLAVNLGNNEVKYVAGLVACVANPKWEPKYGLYLGTMTSFINLEWQPGKKRPWEEAEDRLDFNLKSLAS